MSWYRKYRPQTISGLHLSSVREQFEQYLKTGRLPQVLLLAGPKGSGKTSTARILASIVNDPENSENIETIFSSNSKVKKLVEPNQNHELVKKIQLGLSYAVQELDAASNRGIDDVRRLKEEMALPAQEGKIKVYILDEVHMFTSEAFNALLKMLEEPPTHVMFILATTELHKIPETIISRSTLIPFHKATTNELATALTEIAEKEKINYDEEAIESIAKVADGSFRDAVKIGEMLFSRFGKLDNSAVSELTHGYTNQKMEGLLQLVLNKDSIGVVNYFKGARSSHLNSSDFMKHWLEYLHDQLVLSLSTSEAISSSEVLLFLLKALLILPAREVGPIPFLALEISLLDIISRSKKQNNGGGSEKKMEKPAKRRDTTSLPIVSDLPKKAIFSDNLEPLKLKTDVVSNSPQSGDSQKLFEEWKTFIELVEKDHTGVAILLKSAKPLHVENQKAMIAVYYPFHKQCLDEPKTRNILDNYIEYIAGGPVKVEFIVSDERQTPPNIGLITTELTQEIAPVIGLAELAQDILV